MISWKSVIEIGRKETDLELDARESRQAVNKACMYIYTSGTTGPPKGNSYTSLILLFFLYSVSYTN